MKLRKLAVLRLVVLTVLSAPLLGFGQVSIQPASPKDQEIVHAQVAAANIGGEYNPFHTLVTMAGNRVTVSVEMLAVSMGGPILPLDAVLGRFPSGSYDVDVIKRGENGSSAGSVGSSHFDVAARDISSTAPLYDFSDLWWNPSESGWGLEITQHPSKNLFAAWFVYGLDGRPTWYVLPNGTWSNPLTFSGAVYKTTGPYFGSSFTPTTVTVTLAGTATLAFNDFNHATFSYNIDGVSASKKIERQVF